MSSPEKLPLARGREEVRAARALLEAGFPSQAVSHAYMAGFQAATAALRAIGEAPATSTGVLSAFSRHVVGDGGVDHEDGRILRKLFEDRSYVDHALGQAPQQEAQEAVSSAERLVDATARWIEGRPDPRSS